jgi:hypothetical protein
MSTFKDSTGREWTIRFDGLLLAELRQQHQINLADLTGADYLALDRDPAVLTVAVAHLVREQLAFAKLTREQFAAALIGQSLDEALEALWEAAKVFFPPRRLSALQSSYANLRGQWEAMGPTMLLLGQPGVPPMMADALARTMMAAGSTASANSGTNPSATGPEKNRSSAATA